MSKQKVPKPEQIAARAYELYHERGREDGHDLADWFAAERELTDRELTKVLEQCASPARREASLQLNKGLRKPRTSLREPTRASE